MHSSYYLAKVFLLIFILSDYSFYTNCHNISFISTTRINLCLVIILLSINILLSSYFYTHFVQFLIIDTSYRKNDNSKNEYFSLFIPLFFFLAVYLHLTLFLTITLTFCPSRPHSFFLSDIPSLLHSQNYFSFCVSENVEWQSGWRQQSRHILPQTRKPGDDLTPRK